MEDLRNLIELVSSPQVSPIKIFTEPQANGTKLHALFEGIRNGKFLSDTEAAQSIYGCPPSEKRYMVLRKKLLDILADNLAQYNYSKIFSQAVTEKIHAYRTLISIIVLLAGFKRSTANLIASKLLAEAEKYSLTDIRIFCLRTLRASSSLQGNREMFTKYSNELNRVTKLYEEELCSEEICQTIELNYINSVVSKEEVISLAENYLRHIDAFRRDISSFNLEINRYRILFLYLILTKQYSGISEVFAEAQTLFEQNSHLANYARRAEFMVIVMNSAIRTEDYSTALHYALQCQELYPKGASNWFAVRARTIQILLCLGNYDAALTDFINTINMPGFGHLSEFHQDHWVILGGYLSLLIEPRQINISDIQNSKFKNALNKIDIAGITHTANKDKVGMNIAVQVLQILFLISRKDPELAISRINLLKRYMKKYNCCTRYCRTKAFIDTIQVILQPGFSHKKFQTQSNLLRQIQNASEYHLIDDIEIIPYELLWRHFQKQIGLLHKGGPEKLWNAYTA